MVQAVNDPGACHVPVADTVEADARVDPAGLRRGHDHPHQRGCAGSVAQQVVGGADIKPEVGNQAAQLVRRRIGYRLDLPIGRERKERPHAEDGLAGDDRGPQVGHLGAKRGRAGARKCPGLRERGVRRRHRDHSSGPGRARTSARADARSDARARQAARWRGGRGRRAIGRVLRPCRGAGRRGAGASAAAREQQCCRDRARSWPRGMRGQWSTQPQRASLARAEPLR